MANVVRRHLDFIFKIKIWNAIISEEMKLEFPPIKED